MDIKSAAGTKVYFIGRRGYYCFQLSEAKQKFAVGGTEYTVKCINVDGDWSATVTFNEIPGSWNSIMFENATDEYEKFDWFGCYYNTIMPSTPPTLFPLNTNVKTDEPPTYTILTLSKGNNHRSYVNISFFDSQQLFRAQFGEESDYSNTLFTTGEFDPIEIQGRLYSDSYEGEPGSH